MPALWHGLAELAEVYTRHAVCYGPQRLLPAEVLPTGARRSPPRLTSAQDMDRREEGVGDDTRHEARVGR
jgi:hypothetical protein